MWKLNLIQMEPSGRTTGTNMTSSEEMHKEYVEQAAKNIDFVFVPASLKFEGKHYNIPELHWEQECKGVPQDDPRAFGYHVGCFRARFELNHETRRLDTLVLTFEEMTFEGFLHPDDKVRIDMKKDAFTKFRVTYYPKTEKLKLDRLEENIQIKKDK